MSNMSNILRAPERIPSYFACESESVYPSAVPPERQTGLLSPGTRLAFGRLVRAVQQTMDAKSRSAAAW